MWSASLAPGLPQTWQVALSLRMTNCARFCCADPEPVLVRLVLPSHALLAWSGQGCNCQHPGSLQGFDALAIQSTGFHRWKLRALETVVG